MKKMPSPSPTATPLQNREVCEGGKGTLQVLVTPTKWHEASSSQAFKDSQVIFHMCIYCYGVYCSRVKRELDPEVLSKPQPGQHHSAVRCQQNAPPRYLYPETQ